MKKIIITVSILLLIFMVGMKFYSQKQETIAFAEPVVDVLKIAGKSKSEVVSVLGKESSCSQSKYGEACQYQKGETHIVYINGKADWITVEDIDQIPFSTNALTAIGLNPTQPSFKDGYSLQWSSIQGLMEVSIFKGASSSDYAYIKVKTK